MLHRKRRGSNFFMTQHMYQPIMAILVQPCCHFLPATTNLGNYDSVQKIKSWHSVDCTQNLTLAPKD
jgi:hypothetical protein